MPVFHDGNVYRPVYMAFYSYGNNFMFPNVKNLRHGNVQMYSKCMQSGGTVKGAV